MKPFHSIMILAAILLFSAPSLRAEFLVVGIREGTAENIFHWIVLLCVTLAIATLRKSCSKEGKNK